MRPLHLAIDRGLGDVASLLLDSGADPNVLSDLGFTPLAHALAAGNLGLATLLRDRGAKDDAGCALASKDLAAMEKALAGAPRESLDRWLFAASRSGYAEAVAALLRRGADPNAGMKHLLGETPARVSALHAAVKAKAVAAVRALLDAGADPNAGAAEGVPTPLHQAAGAGNLEMVALLVERGADRAARDGDFNATPAGWAEFAGHADVAGML
jgi:ankyrin repeat protein